GVTASCGRFFLFFDGPGARAQAVLFSHFIYHFLIVDSKLAAAAAAGDALVLVPARARESRGLLCQRDTVNFLECERPCGLPND
ncbi:hypothetical protein TSAR_010423, partial [Trichomalopsis sarcophagae]